MGKGDKKSKKGKISMGSFGVSRPRRKSVADVTAPVAEAAPAKKAAAPKAAAPKKEKGEKTDKTA